MLCDISRDLLDVYQRLFKNFKKGIGESDPSTVNVDRSNNLSLIFWENILSKTVFWIPPLYSATFFSSVHHFFSFLGGVRQKSTGFAWVASRTNDDKIVQILRNLCTVLSPWVWYICTPSEYSRTWHPSGRASGSGKGKETRNISDISSFCSKPIQDFQIMSAWSWKEFLGRTFQVDSAIFAQDNAPIR